MERNSLVKWWNSLLIWEFDIFCIHDYNLLFPLIPSVPVCRLITQTPPLLLQHCLPKESIWPTASPVYVLKPRSSVCTTARCPLSTEPWLDGRKLELSQPRGTGCAGHATHEPMATNDNYVAPFPSSCYCKMMLCSMWQSDQSPENGRPPALVSYISWQDSFKSGHV